MQHFSNPRLGLLLLAGLCTSVGAQDAPPLTLTVAYTLTSEQVDSPTHSTDDRIGQAELGLLFHTLQGLQDIRLDARLVNYQYQNNPAQDHTELNYAAAWLWAVTPRLRGHLNLARQEAPKADVVGGEGNVPNRQTQTHLRADADYEVGGPWHLVAGLSRNRHSSQYLTSNNADSRSDAVDVGVRYDAASGSWVKFSLRSADGSYLAGPGASEDSYQQREQDVRVHWAVSAASSLDLHLTRLERSHPRQSELDFTGQNYGADASWALSARSTLVLSYAHAESVALRPAPFLTEQDSLSWGWNWQTSSRTQVRVGQTFRRIDYRSPSSAGPAGYQDHRRDTSLSLVWTPGTRWQVSAALQRQAHGSSRAGLDQRSNQISLSARFSF